MPDVAYERVVKVPDKNILGSTPPIQTVGVNCASRGRGARCFGVEFDKNFWRGKMPVEIYSFR